MAKLPPRTKVSVLCFRRAGPDEILLVPREVKRALQWGIPSTECPPGDSVRETARRCAAETVRGEPLGDLDLGVEATYRVGDGPRAGEWTEKFLAVEFGPSAHAREGRWAPHYEAKVEAGRDAPRVREAVTRLRELARLKP